MATVIAMVGWPDIPHAYDVVARDYADKFEFELDGKPFDRRVLDGYAAALRGRGLVVDAGCGPAAQIGRYLADRGVAITGLDLSTGVIAEARRRQPGMPFVVADLRALPYAGAGVAGLVAFYSAIHLPRPQLLPAFGEFARVLAADGMLLLAMHGGTGEVGADGWLGADVSVRATLVELPELVRLLDAAGLDVIEQHERQPYPDEYPSQRLYVVARRPGHYQGKGDQPSQLR